MPVFCVALCAGAVFSFSNNKVKASASTANTVAVGELTFAGYATHEDGKAFDSDKLAELYGKLLGTTTKADMTYANVAALGTMTSADIRSKNSGQDVLVTFGGFQWTVTYLTQESGNVVLDLWLAESTDTSMWTDGWFCLGSNTWTYPANLYGTSYIRAISLNNGGFYTYAAANDGITMNFVNVSSESQVTSTTATQSASHKFAKFTMDGIDGSLTDYLLTPAQVSYQASESFSALCGGAADCSNEGYTSGASITAGYNYESNPKYDAWINDKLWLPSFSETGTGDGTNGIWKCSNNQKSNSVDTWTRTAKNDYQPNGSAAHKITASGGYSSVSNGTNENFAVRPAIHLNLTAAESAKASAVKVPDLTGTTTVTYNGSAQSILFNSDYDATKMQISSAADGTKTATIDNPNGKVTATKAGKYTIKVALKANDLYWDDTVAVKTSKGANKEREFTYTIKPYELEVPVIGGGAGADKKKYFGASQTFTVNNFKTYSDPVPDNAVDVKSLASDITQGTGADVNKFSVTDVKKYKVTFEITDKDNFIWKGSNAATATTDREVEFEIEKKPLEIEFTRPSGVASWLAFNTNSTGNIGYSIASSTPAVSGETPTFVLGYFNTADGESTKTDVTGTDIPVATIAAGGVGEYTVIVTFANDSAGDNVNKNYVLTSGKDRQALKINAGEASLDDIGFAYTDSTMAEGEDPKELPSGGLKYEYDKTAKSAVEYELLLDLSALSYLETVGRYSYSYADGTSTINKAGEVTVTVNVQIKPSAHSTNKMPATYTGTKFIYSRIDDYTGTITFKHTIAKATMSLTESDIPLQYRKLSGSWTVYDRANPPQFYGDSFDIRVNPDSDLYPDGVTAISLSPMTATSGTVVGKYNLMAAITVSGNYDSVSPLPISWEISPEILALDWQDKCLTVNGIDFWVPELNATADQAKNLKYEYYYADGPDKDTKIADIEDLCTADRLTSPINLYVKVVQTGGTNQFKLADDPVNNYQKPFTLGENKTLVNVTVDISETISYGDDKTVGVSLINSLTGNALNESFYELNIYRGADKINLANNTALGSLKDFVLSFAEAGDYIIEIKLLPDSDGNIRYALDRSRLVTFEILKKEIALPTVGEIVFSGNYINLVDYLGGSYEEYKDIISISGDYFDIRNVSQSGYKAKLTLTNPNYKWATPSTAETASLKLFVAKLFDNELAVLDDSTVELNWNIAPLVVDASEMWNKGKEGATLNLPENINALITGETLTIGYRYYDDAGQYIESPELAGGKSFRVEAIFGGIDADSGNVLFKTADGNLNAVSDKISYTVPQSGVAAFFGSTLNFLKANWLWFVIGAAVLLFLIILICIIAAAKKKKKKREELEEQRRLEKEEREREERRLEREERMARMNQQQAMPQPQYIPQPMPQMQPQYMPQQVQPMTMPVGGGSMDGAQFALIQAELAAIKAEQSAAKELAAIRAEQNAARELAELKAQQAAKDTAEQQVAQSRLETQVANMATRLGGEQVVQSGISNGITLDKLTELIRTEVNNAFDSREKVAVTEKPENGAASAATTQVPPDAVMTTVTTTKIDTTKKNAQGTARPVVRNYVAPMPVDDGRVFDVGGFYKPADPIELTFEDENKKD